MRGLARIFACGLIFLALLGSAAGQAAEATGAYIGVWKQTRSNAGACDRCTIRVERQRDGFAIIANNGWRATVRAVAGQGRDGLPALQGTGRWAPTASPHLAGRHFRLSLTMQDGRLRMRMVVPRSGRDGRQRILADFILTIAS